MNHELGFTAQSEPVVGAAQKPRCDRVDLDPGRGRRSDCRPTRLRHDLRGEHLPRAGTGRRQRGSDAKSVRALLQRLSRGPGDGFDRYIYLTNEEDASTSTFDGRGGLSVAIYDNELHTLPKLGRYSKENTVVQPGQGTRTVIFSLEDGPAALENQLYMYVGQKERAATSVLARNGLDNGSVYVFRSLDPARNSERTFTSGSVTGVWIKIPDVEARSADELEAASDAAGAMTFVRPEDGAFNPRDRNELLFDTTGSSSGAGRTASTSLAGSTRCASIRGTH